MTSILPGYIRTHRSGELRKRIGAAYSLMKNCGVCARRCGVNRLKGETGFCETGKYPVISSYSPHFGEEDPLVGAGGSGTIFVTHCNLKCVFCQNFEISHEGEGEVFAVRALTEMMLRLQSMGCHNINFVSPSHIVPQILAALPAAIERGLSVPLVYNTGAYDELGTLRLLEGVFDIYMPDFKFWSTDLSREYLDAENYPETARRAIIEMHRQVGELEEDEHGVAVKGLLIRHLVMPGCTGDSADIFRFIAHEISPATYVNVMAQYRPCGQAYRYPELAERTTMGDYSAAVVAAGEAGLTRLDGRRPKSPVLWNGT